MKRWRRVGWLLAAGLVCSLPLQVAAQVTTGRSASILVFPRVVARADADTTIQISNGSRNTRHLRCYYVNGAPGTPPLQRQTAFDVFLTARQPTHWTVSRGRVVDASDEPCRHERTDCDDAGLDPAVPAPPLPFEGALLCIEVDASGFAVPGNALWGEATVRERQAGAAKYSAIGLFGLDSNNMDGVLCLGGSTSNDCPSGAEYMACPATWILNHAADGAEDSLIGGGSSLHTTLTVVPCTYDFVSETPASVSLHFQITNELEQRFSASTSVSGWGDLPLSEISDAFRRSTLATDYAQTAISVAPTDSGRHGFMVVARTVRQSPEPTTLTVSSAGNLHAESTPVDGDIIKITPGSVP